MENLTKMTVDEFTTPSPIFVSPDASYEEVHKMMKGENIRHIPVVDSDNKPVGIISERDVLNISHLAEKEKVTASGFMTENPFCVQSEESLGRVAFSMSKNKVGSAVVTDNEGKLVGIFTSTDALNALVEVLRGDYQDIVGELGEF